MPYLPPASRYAFCVCVGIAVLSLDARAHDVGDQAFPCEQVEAWHREYMDALNRHDVEQVMRFYAPDLVRRRLGAAVESTRAALRDIREWEAPMRAHFAYEIVSVRGEWLTARVVETNALYEALDVRRPLVSEYRWRNGAIVEMNIKEIRDTGKPWRDALSELESWLAAMPPSEVAGVLYEERLAFTGEGGRRLVPLLAGYRKLTAAARAQHVRVMDNFISAMNRHDVDAQFGHYGPDMHFIDSRDGDRRVGPNKEEERFDREFESANNATWNYRVVGAGLDSLDVVITENMDFYELLGVGARSHRARYRFREGRIVQGQTWEWTQQGRPYEGARDSFAAWVARERGAAAANVMRDGRLVFDRKTATLMNPLVREWSAAESCRLYHPSFNSAGTRIAFSSDCDGRSGVFVMNADGTLPRRVTPRDMEARLPNWSPDGEKLVFQSNRDSNWNVYVIAVDGSGLVRLTDHPAAESSGVFAPDGRHILFASDRDGVNDLFVIPSAGGEPVRLTRGAGAGFRSVWAPDGSHVLYRASTPATNEQAVPGEFRRVAPDGRPAGVVSGGNRREYNQAYSPDGSRIAFDAHRSGQWESADGGFEVWVMNADGSNRRPLTHNRVNDWGPAWSPDGRTILFLSGTSNVYDIYLMDADGSNVRRVTHWTTK
jgi:TolB protein